jgi:hypothetical protein
MLKPQSCLKVGTIQQTLQIPKKSLPLRDLNVRWGERPPKLLGLARPLTRVQTRPKQLSIPQVLVFLQFFIDSDKFGLVCLAVESDTSDREDRVTPSRTPSPTPPPDPIPLTPCGIHLIQNGRKAPSVDSRNLDLNVSYAEFLAELFSGLKESPFRLKDSFIQNADATVSWLWLTSSKDQSKTIPPLNALSRLDHYEALRTKVSETAVKNKKLANHVLRIHVELKEQVENDGGELSDDMEIYGRPVAPINSRLDCRPPPLGNVRTLPVFQKRLLRSPTRSYVRT